jgi:TRAP-type uncharacterized transport system fused permease subunit
VVQAFVTAIAGGVCISAAIVGYLFGRLHPVARLVLAACALLFISSGWPTDLAAAVGFGLVAALNRRALARDGQAPDPHGATVDQENNRGENA